MHTFARAGRAVNGETGRIDSFRRIYALHFSLCFGAFGGGNRYRPFAQNSNASVSVSGVCSDSMVSIRLWTSKHNGLIYAFQICALRDSTRVIALRQSITQRDQAASSA